MLVRSDKGMNKKKAIIYYLQLLIKSHESKNNLLSINKKFCGIFMKSRFQYYKPIIKLRNITIIMKLWDVRGINLNIFIKDGDCRVV